MFTGNTAGFSGGGAYIYNIGTLTDNTFTGNTANSSGGGAYVGGAGTLTSNLFMENIANSGGGASVRTGTLTNNLFNGNKSSKNGGGIYLSTGPFTLTNNTISENTALSQGGGIWAIFINDNSNTGKLYNNVLWKNLSPDAADLYIDNTGNAPFFSVSVELFNNDFDQSALGTVLVKPFAIDPSNFNRVDPGFVVTDNDHLLPSSPCVNAGDNNAPDLPETDKDGNPRIVNDVVDMGAYEYNPLVLIITTTAAFSVTSNSAASGGNVISAGGASVTARGVCWSTSKNPGVSDGKTTDGAGAGSFTSSITGLNFGAAYYARAYAINSRGTWYGENELFTTRAPFSVYVKQDAVCNGYSPCNPTGQDGINAADDGYLVLVFKGSYKEDILLDEDKAFWFFCGCNETYAPGSFFSTFNSLTLRRGKITIQGMILGPGN